MESHLILVSPHYRPWENYEIWIHQSQERMKRWVHQDHPLNLRLSDFERRSMNSWIDPHEFSLNNIHTLSRESVMRRNNDHQRENALIFYQILSTSSLRKPMNISMENLYVDIGAQWGENSLLCWLSWEHALQGYRFCRVHVHLCDQLIQLAFALRNKLMKNLPFWQSEQHLNFQKRNLEIPTFCLFHRCLLDCCHFYKEPLYVIQHRELQHLNSWIMPSYSVQLILHHLRIWWKAFDTVFVSHGNADIGSNEQYWSVHTNIESIRECT